MLELIFRQIRSMSEAEQRAQLRQLLDAMTAAERLMIYEVLSEVARVRADKADKEERPS